MAATVILEKGSSQSTPSNAARFEPVVRNQRIGLKMTLTNTFFQIVPESFPSYEAPMAPVPAPVPARAGPVPTLDSLHTSEVLRKMEEMKSRKEEEQRLKREKRINDRSVNLLFKAKFKRAPLVAAAVDALKDQSTFCIQERLLTSSSRWIL